VNKYVHNHLVKNKNGIKINGNTYYTGLEIVCKKHNTTKGRLFVNYTYRIKNIDNNKFTIQDEIEKNEFTFPIDKIRTHFKLPYANTCYSVQGMTVNNNVCIFDCNTPHVDRNYIWTAITRCNALNNIHIFVHSDEEVQRLEQSKINQYLRLKIEHYKEQDKTANRKFKDDDYIDVETINKLLDEYEYKCPNCMQPFETQIDDGYVKSNITVQRNNNELPHVKNNCSLLCCHCNCSLK
jgi:hypothetical protein